MTDTASREHGQRSESKLRIWAPLVAASMAMFIVVVDSTMMNVAISSIVADLKTTVSGVQGAIAFCFLASLFLLRRVPSGRR